MTIIARFNSEKEQTQLWAGRSNDGHLFLGITSLGLDGNITQSQCVHLSVEQENDLLLLLSKNPRPIPC